MRHRCGRRRRSTVLAGVLLIAGCTSDPDPAPTPPVAAPSCPAPADLAPSEWEGTGDVSLWAMYFGNRVVTGQEIKVVWRMAGAGDLTITATGPAGASISPAWGPLEHAGSNFDRPGDEWGTGWIFPAAGCWTFVATRGADTARLGVRVTA